MFNDPLNVIVILDWFIYFNYAGRSKTLKLFDIATCFYNLYVAGHGIPGYRRHFDG